jgi:hypothetical protein
MKRTRKPYFTQRKKGSVLLCEIALLLLAVFVALGGIKGNHLESVKAQVVLSTSFVEAYNLPLPTPIPTPTSTVRLYWSEEEVRQTVADLFPSDVHERFMRILKCENGNHKTDRVNINKDGSKDLGLAQINDKYHRQRVEQMFGEPFEVAMSDGLKNLIYASHLYREWGNLNAWVCNRIIK